MAWHILRKDWKLLWKFVLGVALLNAIQRGIVSSYGAFWNNRTAAGGFLGMIMIINLVVVAALIVMAAQVDAIPSMRADWLVRPIRRRDLLLAKVLFTVILVQAPIFIIEVVQCLAAGFPAGQWFAAPFSRSVWMFAAFDLPVLAFATLTRNLAQAVGAVIAALLLFVCFGFGFAELYAANLYWAVDPLSNQTWVHRTAQVVWGLAAALAILILQYYRRKTISARWTAFAAVLLCLALEFIPWRNAFAVEAHFATRPDAADAIRIAFDPGQGRYRVEHRVNARDAQVWIPLRISGVPEDGMVLTQRVRMTGVAGKSDCCTIPGYIWSVKHDRKPIYQLMFVPRRLLDQPVNLEIHYDLALLHGTAPRPIPTPGAKEWIDGVGLCATRIGTDGEAEMGCLAPGRGSMVEWSDHGFFGDEPQFGPYFGRLVGDSISRYRAERWNGVPELPGRPVTVRGYRPEAYFSRMITISGIRLSDWQAEITPTVVFR